MASLTFCRPSLINFIEKRNTASAPAKLMIISRMSVTFIVVSYFGFASKNTTMMFQNG